MEGSRQVLVKVEGTFTASLNFDDSSFLSQLTQERVEYLFRNLLKVMNYNSFEIWNKSIKGKF